METLTCVVGVKKNLKTAAATGNEWSLINVVRRVTGTISVEDKVTHVS